jgi:hypothetical protein
LPKPTEMELVKPAVVDTSIRWLFLMSCYLRVETKALSNGPKQKVRSIPIPIPLVIYHDIILHRSLCNCGSTISAWLKDGTGDHRT